MAKQKRDIYVMNPPPKFTAECEDSPDGKHHFSPDDEYDQKKRNPPGTTICCEYCGDDAPPSKR